MNIAYFDIFSGISGDMTLGAFVHAGVPLEAIRAELAKLRLHGYSITERKLQRSMISATKIDVAIDQEHRSHVHDHDSHAHAHRSYNSIIALLDASGLSDRTRELSSGMFRTIGVAEASVHQSTLEDIHFHEVGAIDSIVDIVGIAFCMDYLEIDKVYSSPVPVGSNSFINTQHGVMPLPAPATVEILKDYPVIWRNVGHELTTPTGAAVVKTLSSGTFNDARQLRIKKIGYGAGTDEIPGFPNLLRLVIGDEVNTTSEESLLLIETNIDDMNPQVFPYLMEKALLLGAKDGYITPVMMKKGRPGHIVSLLSTEAASEPLMALLYRETTTIGIRTTPVRRHALERETVTVATSLGNVVAKRITRMNSLRLVPEFEECKRLAAEKDMPLLNIMSLLEQELDAISKK